MIDNAKLLRDFYADLDRVDQAEAEKRRKAKQVASELAAKYKLSSDTTDEQLYEMCAGVTEPTSEQYEQSDDASSTKARVDDPFRSVAFFT